MTMPRKYNTISRDDYHVIPASIWRSSCDIIKGENPEDDIYVENKKIKILRDSGAIFVNDAFIELWDIVKGLLFLDGGYGSSKTTYAITRLLVKCRKNKYFKCFYGRQKKTEARELHDNIVREIKRNGWEEEFDFSEKPNGSPDILHIATGNIFKLFGCDDDESLKGIDNPTDILVDEINQIAFSAFGMLLTRLRTPGYVSQLIGCFNNCDVYPDHWLKKFIYNEESEEENMKLTQAEKTIIKALKKLKTVKHHSIYTDNLFQNHDDYLAKLEIKAGGDPVKIQQYCNGDWGVKLNAQPYYKMFKQNLHVKEVKYDPSLALHVSFDENVNPYFPCLISQVHGLELHIIAEIAAVSPNNKLDWVCEQIRYLFPNHTSGMYIYGDATSKKDDVKQERGKNLFTLAMEGLDFFHPQMRVPDANPNNTMRGNFINMIFSKNYGGISIFVSPECPHMIADLQHCEEDPSGNGKYKKRETVNGIQGVQRFGHFGDCMDYKVCWIFQTEYLLFQSGGRSYKPVGGGRVVNNGVSEKLAINAIKESSTAKKYVRRISRNSMN